MQHISIVERHWTHFQHLGNRKNVQMCLGAPKYYSKGIRLRVDLPRFNVYVLLHTRIPRMSVDIEVTVVKVAARVAVNTDIITIPIVIHTRPNKRPGRERGVLSPYLE